MFSISLNLLISADYITARLPLRMKRGVRYEGKKGPLQNHRRRPENWSHYELQTMAADKGTPPELGGIFTLGEEQKLTFLGGQRVSSLPPLLAATNLIGQLMWQVVTVTSQVLPPLSKHCLGALYQTDTYDNSEGFRKYSIWHDRLQHTRPKWNTFAPLRALFEPYRLGRSKHQPYCLLCELELSESDSQLPTMMSSLIRLDGFMCRLPLRATDS